MVLAFLRLKQQCITVDPEQNSSYSWFHVLQRLTLAKCKQNKKVHSKAK